ncbi:MAG TPA: hypothetical protein DCE56_01670 [Cyanobacteria bacterium UBA8553]|nr:hypothetical protein [Cyanobacteria bacterium UBA8553]
MRYEQVKHLKPADFKRFWGVKPETFEKMVEVVTLHNQKKKKTGRPGKVSLEDQVLMTLEYWREYRTYFHIGQSWGVTESTAWSFYSENRKYYQSIKGVHSARKEVPSRIRFINRCRRYGERTHNFSPYSTPAATFARGLIYS